MFRHPIAIADIDEHVNNAVCLRWVQEAVVGYWRKTPAESVAAHLWVALKHEISYRRMCSPR